MNLEHDGYKLIVLGERYLDGTLSVTLWTDPSEYSIPEPYCDVTIDTVDSWPMQNKYNPRFFLDFDVDNVVQYVDLPCEPWLEEFLIKNGLAEPVFDENDEPVVHQLESTYLHGDRVYPLWRFNLKKFSKLIDECRS